MPNSLETPMLPPRRSLPGWLLLIVAAGLFLFVTVSCWQSGTLEPRDDHANHVEAIALGLIVSGGLTGGLYIACRVFRGWIGRTLGTIIFSALMTIVTAAVVFAGCMATNNIYMK